MAQAKREYGSISRGSSKIIAGLKAEVKRVSLEYDEKTQYAESLLDQVTVSKSKIEALKAEVLVERAKTRAVQTHLDELKSESRLYREESNRQLKALTMSYAGLKDHAENNDVTDKK